MTTSALAFLLALPVCAGDSLPAGTGGGAPSGSAAAAEAASAGDSAATAGISAAQADPPRRRRKEKAADASEQADSTSTVKAFGVDDIYGGAKLRDPFMKLSGAGAAVAAIAAPPKEFDPEEFSIHQLELKGIMRDKAGITALLSDMDTHFTFILRGGRLYDMRKKAVPNVTGVILPAQKSVTLTTADKDVQTLRLGEDADEAEE